MGGGVDAAAGGFATIHCSGAAMCDGHDTGNVKYYLLGDKGGAEKKCRRSQFEGK